MRFLFDTDAISEIYRSRPNATFLTWLRNVAPEDQFTSAVVVGELFAGAFLSPSRPKYLSNIRDRLLGQVDVVPFDVSAAEVYGRIRAELQSAGQRLPDADLQIAATAIAGGFSLVSGNVRHFERIAGLDLCRVLADARAAERQK